jgi:hypothetical protein
MEFEAFLGYHIQNRIVWISHYVEITNITDVSEELVESFLRVEVTYR